MKRYVAGFYFSSNMEYVVLIRKNRPDWQKGMLNGVGGHIEPDEHAIDAMVREFHEETGIKTAPEQWHLIVDVIDLLHDTYVSFFQTSGNQLWDASGNQQWESLTDEDVTVIRVIDLSSFPTVYNLKWLIPLCTMYPIIRPFFIIEENVN